MSPRELPTREQVLAEMAAQGFVPHPAHPDGWIAVGDLEAVLAHMPAVTLDEPLDPPRAPEELRALHRAMDRDDPACLGIESFTLDPPDITPRRALELVDICHQCPILDACRAYAHAARPTGGIWAGYRYEDLTTRRRTA